MSLQLTDTKKLGNAGEQFVVEHLKRIGFTICAQNYRKFFGEVDIIACKKNLYVFVEVKTRTSDAMPMGNLIGLAKQMKIIKTAQTFIAENKLGIANICRFDVALVITTESNFSLTYIENAFTKPESDYGY